MRTSTDEFVASGHSNSAALTGNKTAGTNGRDFWVIKMDTGMNVIWEKNYGGSGNDRFNHGLVEASDGHYVIAGSSNSPADGNKTALNRGDFDYWVLKIDSGNGNIIWDYTFGGTSAEELASIQMTLDSGFVVGGLSASARHGAGGRADSLRGGMDYWAIKLDSTGTREWDRAMGTTSTDPLHDEFFGRVFQINDGDYVACGNADDLANGDKTFSGVVNWYQDWMVRFADGVLPVTLLSFDGVYSNEETNLEWVTETEINNDRFEIERSRSGTGLWETVGVIKGGGNSNNEIKYNFTDQPNKETVRWYYRLKQVDYDGTTSYSDIITIKIERSDELDVLILSENPVTDRIRLSLPDYDDDEVSINIVSLEGKNIMGKRMENTGVISLNTKHFPVGFYLMNIKSVTGNAQYFYKFVKL